MRMLSRLLKAAMLFLMANMLLFCNNTQTDNKSGHSHENSCSENITYHKNAGWPMAVIDREEYFQYINSRCKTQTGAWIISVTTNHNGTFMVLYTRRSEDSGRTRSNRTYAYDAGKPYNDLTYGYFHEESPGEYYHFYKARWESIQVNRIDPELLTPPS